MIVTLADTGPELLKASVASEDPTAWIAGMYKERVCADTVNGNPRNMRTVIAIDMIQKLRNTNRILRTPRAVQCNWAAFDAFLERNRRTSYPTINKMTGLGLQERSVAAVRRTHARHIFNEVDRRTPISYML